MNLYDLSGNSELVPTLSEEELKSFPELDKETITSLDIVAENWSIDAHLFPFVRKNNLNGGYYVDIYIYNPATYESNRFIIVENYRLPYFEEEKLLNYLHDSNICIHHPQGGIVKRIKDYILFLTNMEV